MDTLALTKERSSIMGKFEIEIILKQRAGHCTSSKCIKRIADPRRAGRILAGMVLRGLVSLGEFSSADKDPLVQNWKQAVLRAAREELWQELLERRREDLS